MPPRRQAPPATTAPLSNDRETISVDTVGSDLGAGHWTLDNASNNGAFLTSLQAIYRHRRPDLVFDAQDSRVACFPHNINNRVQHAMEASSDGADPDLEEDNDVTQNDAHFPADLLGKIRSLIKAIRVSEQRQASFDQVVLSGNDAGWWRDENDAPTTVEPLRFFHDVKTRWDSTYQMLVRLRMLKQPLDQFLSLGSSSDIEKFRLSAAEWIRVTDMIGKLQYLHFVQ